MFQCSQNHLRISLPSKAKIYMSTVIHSKEPKINFTISENILATSQLFRPDSDMYYFQFVITSRKNHNSISIDYDHYTVHQLTLLTKIGSLTLTLSKKLLLVMLLLTFIGNSFDPL